MITRRTMIKWSAAASALAGAGVSQAALAQGTGALDALLLDSRFAPDLSADYSGVKLLHISGDVTKVWFETLDPAWRQRGFVLGGLTGSDALFVLENLARQQGRRVVARNVLGQRDARGIAPVSWIIAPVHPSVVA